MALDTKHAKGTPLVWTVALVAAVANAACAARPAAAPPSGEPITVEQAQREIADLRRELGGGPGEGEDQERKKNKGSVAPMAPPPPGSPSGGAADRPSADSRAASTSEEPPRAATCATPCRAIASMRRAVGSLCRLAGETDARCLDARHTLVESERLVAPCGC